MLHEARYLTGCRVRVEDLFCRGLVDAGDKLAQRILRFLGLFFLDQGLKFLGKRLELGGNPEIALPFFPVFADALKCSPLYRHSGKIIT